MTTSFALYRRKQIAELRPYQPGDSMDRVSISAPDREAGSPKPGDMIARNPKNHDDQWLVAADYFADNFEPVVDDLTSDPQRILAAFRAMGEHQQRRSTAQIEAAVKAMKECSVGGELYRKEDYREAAKAALTAAAEVEDNHTWVRIEAYNQLEAATIERCAQWLVDNYEMETAANQMRRELKDKP